MSKTIDQQMKSKYNKDYAEAHRKIEGGRAIPRVISEKELSMPSFREAFPTPDYLDDEGCRLLTIAILNRAAEDYYDVCDHPDDLKSYAPPGSDANLRTKKKIDEFIESTWFDTICDIPGSTFKKIIKKHKANGKFPNVTKPRNTDVVGGKSYTTRCSTERVAKGRYVTYL